MASRLMSMHEQHEASKPPVKPRALIVVADGSDEFETLVLSDLLARGGMHISTASVGLKKDNVVTANFGMQIKAEHAFEDCSYRNYELLVLPGGLGANRLRDCALLVKMLTKQRESGKWIAGASTVPAIVLKTHGLLPARATCARPHDRLMPNEYEDAEVVVDGRCVTSRGAGSAMLFALTLVELLCGHSEAKRVAADVCFALP